MRSPVAYECKAKKGITYAKRNNTSLPNIYFIAILQEIEQFKFSWHTFFVR